MTHSIAITLVLHRHNGLCIVESPEHPDLFVCDETFAGALARLPDYLEAIGRAMPITDKQPLGSS